MSGISTVTIKGQVTIPTSIRKLLSISAGDKVYFETDSTTPSVKVRKVAGSVVDELSGSLHSPIGYVSIDTAREKAGLELGKKYK